MQARAHGAPPIRGRIRVSPEDFEVDEVLGFEPDGHGTHVLLRVEKSGANTAWVASQLARAGQIPAAEVGFSGFKDRRALTRQAFTVPVAASDDLSAWRSHAGEGYRVLDAQRHTRKLRRGSHRSNRFRIVVREVSGAVDELPARIEAIGALGVPNYFGAQRFGRASGNLVRARSWAAGGEAPRERQSRSFALSAARSELFNRVVAERVRLGCWNRLLPGEAIVLDGRRSFFTADAIDAALEARCAEFDVHPSGPLHGRGEIAPCGAARDLERSVLATEPALVSLLEREGLQNERRPTRLRVSSLVWRRAADVLELEFELGRGGFATTLLGELVAGDAEDADVD
jgi:tRNA pseudouridine13 synthase